MNVENRRLSVLLVFLASLLALVLVLFSAGDGTGMLGAGVVPVRTGACYDEAFGCIEFVRGECLGRLDDPYQGCFWTPNGACAAESDPLWEDHVFESTGTSTSSMVSARRQCYSDLIDATTGDNYPCASREQRVVIIDTRQCEGTDGATLTTLANSPTPQVEYTVRCGKVIRCIPGHSPSP